MSEVALTVHPKLGSGDEWTSAGPSQSIDLSTRRGRRYVFPKALHEFEEYEVALTLESDGGRLRVSETGNKASVKRLSDTRCKYLRNLAGKARQGVVKDRFDVEVAGYSYRVSVLFPLEGEALDRQQYDLMLEDISHWLHASLHRQAEHEVVPEAQDVNNESLKADIETFYRVRSHVSTLDKVLKRISTSPKEEIVTQYKQTRKESPKQDSRTLRWNEVQYGTPESLTYDSTRSFNVYENKFILFLIHTLDRLLNTVESSAIKTEEKLADNLWKTRELYEQGMRNRSQVLDAEEDHEKSKVILDEISDMRRCIRKMERYPFLRYVSYDPSQFRISFSLGLTQDVNYSQIFNTYRKINQDSRLRRLNNIGQFVEGIDTLGVQKTSQVYEYWTFFATYRSFLKLGFTEGPDNSLVDMIDQESLTPGLIPGKFVDLYYQPQDEGSSSQGPALSDLSGVRLRLHYEKSFFWEDNPTVEKARPDITIDVYQNHRYLRGRFMLDAKYKTFDHSDFEDAKDQARKYQAKQAGGRIEEGIGAFLLHLNTEKEEFDQYNCMNREKWLGYLPVLPGNTNKLDVLLEMHFLSHRVPRALD